MTKSRFIPALLLAGLCLCNDLPVLAATDSATKVAQTVSQLRQIKTDGPEVEVPAAATPLLTQLRHQLRDLILETINRQPSATPEQLQAKVLTALRNAGVFVGVPKEDGTDYVYGDIYEVTIARPAKHPNLLAATTTIGVCCGEDTSLYLFKRNQQQWTQILADESTGYKEISGAQGTYEYAISDTDAKGDFFVVTVNVNPWCTSNWQTIRYKVLRPGLNAESPGVMLQDKQSIYLGMGDPVYKLSLKGNTFTLTFETYATLREMSDGYITHPLLLKYLVAGNRVKKLAAIAKKPRI